MPAPSTTGGNGLMGYPSSVDIGAAAQKTGLAQISGGALQWGVPGNIFTGNTTFAVAANTVYYAPLYVMYQHILTAWQAYVSTGPASAANIAIGIYRADGTVQPTGAPLYDSGSVAVAQSFTGIKTASGLSVSLVPGMYLAAICSDTAMTFQVVQGSAFFLVSTFSTTPISKILSVAQTFGAYPTPGTAWTNTNASGAGQVFFSEWQWTE